MPFGRALQNLINRQTPDSVAKASIAAINERRWDDFRALLADGFLYRDSEDREIDSAERFIRAMEGMLGDAPDFLCEVEDYRSSGNTVVMKGFTTSQNPRFCTVSAWKLDFSGGRISCWQNYRANDTVKLYTYDPPAT